MRAPSPFLAGSLFGVCITVGFFYVRGPAFQRLLSRRADSRPDTTIVVPLRAREASLGVAAAPVTIIEYSDFQCPYCAMFRNEIFPKIKTRYIDSGQVRFIHRQLPLPFHAQAMPAARAAACAGDQGLYWELSNVMFARKSCLECLGAVELSKAIPLNRPQFEKCVASNRHQAEIEQDVASARELKFEGTPSFVIGRTVPTGVEGVAMVGAVPFEEFAAKIDPLLARATAARR